MIEIIITFVGFITLSIIGLLIYQGKKKKFYCDLYKDSKLFNSGLCSAGSDCDICPHKKRLI